MATSTCPKCTSTAFELKTPERIAGSNYTYDFIQCAGCGTVVGVVDAHHVPSLLQQIATKFGLQLR